MNPISHARYLSTMSTMQLSKRLDVSRQYISRLEQGLYDRPNKELLNWTVSTLNRNLAEDKHVTPVAVEQLYKEWQWQKRQSCKINKSLLPCRVSEFDRVEQPDIIYYHKIFARWRSDNWESTHSFCVDMCLHPSPVGDYEDGQTRKMPNSLKDVMMRLGLLGNGFKTGES
jgi:transcriptional regulator with XRE-family HTH domain